MTSPEPAAIPPQAITAETEAVAAAHRAFNAVLAARGNRKLHLVVAAALDAALAAAFPVLDDGQQHLRNMAYDAGAKAERERCAQLAETEAAKVSDVGLAHAFRNLAALLRKQP